MRKFRRSFRNTGGEDLFSPRSRIGHTLRPIFMLCLVKMWQVTSCGKFMQHLKSCLLWQLKLTEFLSFSTGCTQMKYSCYQQSLVKVGNPIWNGIVFVFHLAWKAWSNTAISGKTTHDATTELTLSLLVVPLSSQLVSKLYVWISVTPKEIREWWTGWRPLAKTTSEHTSTRATMSQQQRRWRRPCYPTEEWKVSELLSCFQ